MLDNKKSNEELFLEKLKCESFEKVVDNFYRIVEVRVKMWRDKLNQIKESMSEVVFQDYLNQERQKLVDELRTLKNSDFEFQYNETVLNYREIWLSEIQNILSSLTWKWSAEQVKDIMRVNMKYKIVYDCLQDPFFEQPPVATSTEVKQEKKEINITPENAELIYRALVPYFIGQETSLRQLLNGERIEKPLGWSKNANQLTHIFWSAKRIGYISDSNIQICEWILTNFRYNNGKKFERSSVTKDLNTQATRCKKPLPNSYF